jgi:hypothetical protein
VILHQWWQGTPQGGLINLSYVVNIHVEDRALLTATPGTSYEIVYETERDDYTDTYPTAADRDIAFSALMARLGVAPDA